MYIWSNEAWFASPAFTLLHHGFLGTTIFDPRGTWMEGIDRHTYWTPPLYPLVETAWYAVTGFSLFAMRSISIVSGAVVLLAWYAIVRKLTRSDSVALLATALTAIETHFLIFGALGRADMLCAALGTLGFAAYLRLREGSLTGALAAGHALAAASCLAHPCGVLYASGLLVLMLYLDRSRIGLRADLVAAIALPYVAGLAAWGVYILRAPADFVRQFTGNISGIAAEFTTATRGYALTHPFSAFKREYVLRYGGNFGWFSTTRADRIELFALLVYTAAVLYCLATPSIRRHAGARGLLLLGAWDFLVMAFFDGLKGSAYLVHTLPLCGAFAALAAQHLMRDGTIRQWAAVAALALLVAAEVGTTVRYVRVHAVRDDFERAAQLLKQSAAPSEVIATGEFAFALGFDSGMVDDMRLGYFTGRRPKFIAAGSIYRGWFERSAVLAPEIHAYIIRLLSEEYRVALQTNAYTVYQRVDR
jgi:4-amino-4-deoxy-L-arabinose transferase-like glycosyltransferase